MKNLVTALTTIYNNIPLIFAIAIIVVGIAVKINNFLHESAAKKKEILKAQARKLVDLINEELLSLVTKAEKEWGAGTGTIKKSWVWEQLQAQQEKLSQYISEGLISKNTIDELIETAVDELNKMIKENSKVATVATKE